MKLGDTFVDGGWKHEVIGFDGSGLPIAKKIELAREEKKPVVKVEETKEVKEEVKYTKTEISRASQKKLEEICESLGLEKATATEMRKNIIAKLGL